jgi:hypothetical protein
VSIRAITPVEGDAAEAYARIRTCTLGLERVLETETKRPKRTAIKAAIQRLAEAEADLRRAANAEGKTLLPQPAPGAKPRSVAGCYPFVRQAAQLLNAAAKTPNPDVRKAVESALANVYSAEDELKRADA